MISIKKNPETVGKLKVGTSSATPADGTVHIGSATATASANGDDLVIANTSGHAGITIRTSNTGSSTDGGLYFSDGDATAEQTAGYLLYLHDQDKMLLGTADSTRLSISSTGVTTINNDLVLNDATGLASIKLQGGAVSAVNYEIMQGITGVANAGFSIYDTTNSVTRMSISSTGLATFSGDTKLADGLVSNYVKHVAGLDDTVAISFTFPSQSSRYIHQMLELRVAMGDDGASTATPTFLRYAFTTLTTASGITQIDASLGTGITASTGASGTTFTVTLTEGSAISMDNVTVFATVTSGHADAKCTGMTVA
jgi:hypothetical protein